MKYLQPTDIGNTNIDLGKDIQLALRITSSLLNEPLVEVTPLVGKGRVNRVFIVEAVKHRVVIRMSDRGEALDEYSKEAWCIQHAAARGVLVPSVISVGRCEGNAYIIQSYIAGDDGSDSSAPKLGIWKELGKYAKLIHTIGVPGFGLTLSEITRGDARKSWLRYLEDNIESLTENDPLIKLKVLTQLQSKLIRDVFAGLRGREFTFGLNHGDLSLRNTIVDKRGRVTLLDWGSAEAGIVPHHDLIQMLRMNMLEGDPNDAQIRAFLDGYGMSPAEFKRMMPELESLLVLRAFDQLRWAIDWSVENLDGFVRNARECASYLLRAPV
jgi:aminoglycoside phosphotransferase (APT) family kinase protein